MNGYKIVGFNIIDFKGIEIVKYAWKGNEGLVVVGDHGEGKSNVIEALNVLLEGAKALKKIDNPVHIGAKKYKIEADFEGSGDALSCYDIGNKFRVTATQSTTGSQQLKIENLGENGLPVKASCRDILKTLRGLYVDPHQLMIELKEGKGDRNLADKVLKNIGLDLSEFDLVENGDDDNIGLAAQWSADNQEVERNRKVLESIDIPVDGFPDEKIDIDILWEQNKLYSAFKEQNQDSEKNKALLEAEKVRQVESIKVAEESKNNFIENELSISARLANLNIKNNTLETETIKGLKELLDDGNIEFVKKMTNIVLKADKVKAEFQDTEREINRQQELVESNNSMLSDCVLNIESFSKKLSEVNEQITILETGGEKWEGLHDPFGELTPDLFIAKKIQDAQDNNTIFLKKEERSKAEENLKAAELSRDKTNRLRKENIEARTKAVAGADFQIDGLSVNESGVLTAKVDGRPTVTLRDLNHADQLRVLSDILMVNNDKPLKLIVIKEGYACKPEYQKIIFDQARNHGYTAIMESFTSVEDEGCLYMKDGMSSDTPPVDLEVFESDENVVDEKSKKPKPNWG